MILIFSSGFCKLAYNQSILLHNSLNLKLNNPVGIILGSGLNKFSDELESQQLIYEDNASFHKLKVLSGKIMDKDVVMFSGRKHFYEGYSKEMILQNISLAKKLGVNLMFITNAAGGLNSNFKVSDLMLITSHLNFNHKIIPSGNSAFPYDSKFIASIKELALSENIDLKNGSYCCLSGPCYETKSEIRFLNKYRVDAVGMSTVPEIIHSGRIGIRTISFSCITNLLSENSNSITTHDEVVEAGKKSYNAFSKLMKAMIVKSDKFKNPFQ